MHHTLVAVFDNHTDAQQARDELLAAGFSHDDLRLSCAGTPDSDADSGGGIRHFFGKLFCSDDGRRAEHYESALARGQHLLTLGTDSPAQAERAASLIQRYRPVDVDHHAEGGTTPGAGAMLSSGSAMGAATMSARAVQLDADHGHFRSHFDSTYSTSGANWDDYAPAYGYGSQIASSERYTGRAWDEIEPELRGDWETRGAGDASTWEKMKTAVRHGWDRIVTGNSGMTY